ncbi:hypothetical protein [Micromonospora tulbaghiae]|uniref:hypothetical protein n=1 Tax=Micromonospora tulbaghiae TaxID=479978 RepID=UPI0033FE9E19
MTDTRTKPQLQYHRTGLHPDSIRVAAIIDGAAVWTFEVVDLTAEYQRPMIDVVVPHFSFGAFVDARDFFDGLAQVGPDTISGVIDLLRLHGFAEVEAPEWAEQGR